MSSFYYNQEHSVTFGEKNTWEDWKLIPNTRPSFSPPQPKNTFLDIPGGNGTIDLSESLTGYPLYQDRTGSWEFIVADQERPWSDVYSEIMTYLQGKRFSVVLEDDPYFHYEGRFWVNEYRSDPNYSLIVIEYMVGPYKLEPNNSVEPWLWDPFDFKYGVVRNFGNLTVDGELRVVLPTSEIPSSPLITSNGTDLKVQYNGATYDLSNGVTVIPSITVKDKEITLIFTGNGTVSINYRGGRL